MLSLQIFLFGSPRIELNNEVITFPRRKAVALLAYLAVTQKTHTRDHLATLLWPENDQTSARTNLRRILYMLRKALGVDYFEITRQYVGLKSRKDLWTDVIYFQDQIAAVKRDHTEGDAICDTCIATLTDAVKVYAAPFMDGFSILGAPAFDEWQFFSAESLQQSLATSLQHLLEWHTAQEIYPEAITYARRWSTLDSLHEPAQRQLMWLYAQSGQQAAALRQYHECVRLLDVELGVEPEPKTQALFEAIQSRRLGQKHDIPPKPTQPKTDKAPPAHNLPIYATPFIGRKQELTTVTNWLKEPNHRLMTVVGSGGMGKTRLTVAAASLVVDSFIDGVCFVSLAALTSAENIIQTIADSLHFRFTGSSSPQEQLLAHLRPQNLLLVIDNFEHLLVGANLVSEILQASPNVTILATSRERLNLLGEEVFRLGGLEMAESDSSQLADATQLWQQHAQLSRPNIKFKVGDLEHISAICHMVQGMPLALILAARWSDVLPVAEIAAEIRQDLDFLETTMRDVPERQRSMRAVFDASYGRLLVAEQAAFRQLSVFRGGFTRAAAQSVAGANLRILRSLVQHSFITMGTNGRYQIHELLRQYAAEKLGAMSAESKQTTATHSHYFLNQVHQLTPDLYGGRQLAALNNIETDIENIRSAWTEALNNQNQVAIEHAIDGLTIFFDLRAHRQDGVAFFRLASQQLTLATTGEQTPLWGRVTSRLCVMRLFMADVDDTMEATIRRCLAIAQKSENQAEIAFAFDLIATLLCVYKDNREYSLDYFKQSLAIYESIDNSFYTSRGLISIIYFKLVDVETSRQYAAKALRLSQTIGDDVGMTYALVYLGEQALGLGKYEQAMTHCQEAANLATKMELSIVKAHVTMMLSLILFLTGDQEESERMVNAVSDEARVLNFSTVLTRLSAISSVINGVNGRYELAKQLGQKSLSNPMNDKFGFVLAYWALALTYSKSDENGIAWGYAKQFVEQARAYGATAFLTWILPITAVLLSNESKFEQAVEHLALASSHPQSPTGWFKQWSLLTEWQQQWQQQLGVDCYQATWARGQQSDLDAILSS